jgi:hypothetical protein
MTRYPKHLLNLALIVVIASVQTHLLDQFLPHPSVSSSHRSHMRLPPSLWKMAKDTILEGVFGMITPSSYSWVDWKEKF